MRTEGAAAQPSARRRYHRAAKRDRAVQLPALSRSASFSAVVCPAMTGRACSANFGTALCRAQSLFRLSANSVSPPMRSQAVFDSSQKLGRTPLIV
jgi:hypothetical protein